MSLTTDHLRDALARCHDADGTLFVRITRRREIYVDMLTPVPWIIRGNNALLSLAAVIVVSIACLLAS